MDPDGPAAQDGPIPAAGTQRAAASPQVQLIKHTPGYRMDVYPTHRRCANPDFVEQNTKKNATAAKLGTDGWSLKEGFMPGIPFPIPKSGAEAMWNYKMKYAGIGFEWARNFITLSPRKGVNDWIQAGATQTYFFPWGAKGSTSLAELPPIEYYTYFAYESPTALAGQALAIAYYTDRVGSDTFYYFPGQRRVRRMPSYSNDAPQIGFENQYTLDEPRMFNGTIDRFDRKLVGKKKSSSGSPRLHHRVACARGRGHARCRHRRRCTGGARGAAAWGVYRRRSHRVAALVATLKRTDASPVHSVAGPLWYRGTAMCPSAFETNTVSTVLGQLAGTSVVIGPTITETKRVTTRIDGRVTMIDTGMLPAYHGQPSALVLEGDARSVVYARAPGEQAKPEPEARRVRERPGGLDDDGLEEFLRQAAVIANEAPPLPRAGTRLLTLQRGDGEAVPVRPAKRTVAAKG